MSEKTSGPRVQTVQIMERYDDGSLWWFQWSPAEQAWTSRRLDGNAAHHSACCCPDCLAR